MKALVLAETIDGQRALCAGARSIADEVVLAVVKGAPETGIADKAYDIELPAGEPVENAAAGVIAVYNAENPDVVLVEPTPRDKILAGLLAASLGASVISDVTAIDGDVVTGADLTKVDVVVGAGRGFAEEDELQIARDLCEKVGGELGCSRPLAENVNWLPKNLYIGVSGLQLAPKAYIALGISGQMQHMVGVTGADTIIAVNKDANAPIFKQADYGIVGDIKTVVPALIEKL